ncbi:hypothetical protein [Thalassospira sp. MCCC 1A01428]|uniref:hypothetical protein n=1 Tax=Thalassospira sp. MCCC 1A01428 TaxID=1470575 RepID=UPI000A1F73C8|nr:hypothetical protein [Thalassospira sp. MCCC 1A01428]OSQ42283.1 hypothetical protein THS27_14775 [Thalassospira sp. MCCC 1A01428]
MTFVYIFIGVLVVAFIIGMIVVKPENAGSKNKIVIVNPAITEFEMPDIGLSDTATEAQKNSIAKTLGARLPEDISKEQASLVLDARQYAHGMLIEFEKGGVEIDETTGTRTIMFFILAHPEIRDYVNKWSRGRFERGTHQDVPKLTKNEHYQKVHDYLVSQAGREPVKPAKRKAS